MVWSGRDGKRANETWSSLDFSEKDRIVCTKFYFSNKYHESFSGCFPCQSKERRVASSERVETDDETNGKRAQSLGFLGLFWTERDKGSIFGGDGKGRNFERGSLPLVGPVLPVQALYARDGLA